MNLNQQDFTCVGQLATHCDNAKLCIAVDEARIFDMQPLLCELFPEVVEHWDDETEPWSTVINGGTYTGCGGKQREMLGVKRVFTYFAYARYVMLNGWNDTPNGSVQKTNQWSIPKPLAEVESYSNKYRGFGFKAWKGVENYLCLNREEFPNFNPKACKGCGCNEGCEGSSNKGYGSRARNLTKYDHGHL